MRETGPMVAHNAGRPRATDRKQPRRSKREAATHTDKYWKSEDERFADSLRALATHFNGEESADA